MSLRRFVFGECVERKGTSYEQAIFYRSHCRGFDRVGRGNVISFASDPTNRGLNHAGMRMLLHAIHVGPSVSGAQPLGEDDDEHQGSLDD
jgi:hypothetical protein